ncbi:MAG: GDP-mannose 4,6-dehydratase, partial [Actinomycetota bacterium]|nr:GDP-mannose 4,6-dehydratase [Actinomycetota bacterium]
MRALITGGRGFVGTWLAEHLRSCGDEVVAVDAEVDVTDPAAVSDAVDAARPDAVYHLAALAHVGQSWADPAAVVQVNALGTLSVLEAARQVTPAPTVLVTSSAEVYGRVPADQQPIGESQPLAPVTPYAASKVAAEYLCVQAHLAHDLPVIRVRPFNHVGPGQAHRPAGAG